MSVESPMIGRTIAHYRIREALGAGGMGEVYLARDEKLGRDVAIKVLAPSIALSPVHLERFDREAQLLAALNHPNIATIHGIEQCDDTRAIVLELVEGETLAERIRKGPIVLADALAIAGQIAAALEYAHDRGIVHRDLKPANIKITPDDVVKVLDFGIAKALQVMSGASDSSTAQTVASDTKPGEVIGTPAYMSPEQARGHRVDRRTDVWAFGCVCYEMLTGARAIPGETPADAVGAILTGEPDWSALPASVPPGVRAVLQTCLRKDAKRRPRDLADIRITLDDAVIDGHEHSRPSPSAPIAWPLWRWPALAAALVLAGIAGWFVRAEPEPTAPGQPVRLVVPLNHGESLVEVWPSVALSPNGRKIAYVTDKGAGRQIYLRSLDSFEVTPVPGTERGQGPFFSPDGEWLGFFAEGRLKKVLLSEGVPIELCRTSSFASATWGPDHTIVFASFYSGLWQVPDSGGEPEALTKLDAQTNEFGHWAPAFLPDGKTVAFMIWRRTAADARIALYSRETRETTVVLEQATNPLVTANGFLLFVRDATLHAVKLTASPAATSGPVFPVLPDVMWDRSTGVAQVAVSRQGTLVYATKPKRRIVWVDRRGNPEPVFDEVGNFSAPSLSPEGGRIALTRDADVWIHDLVQQRLTRLTFNESNLDPIWTPDGERVTFGSFRNGSIGLFEKPADGSAEEALLITSSADQTPGSWAPDGRRLAFVQTGDPSTRFDVMILSIDEQQKVAPFQATVADENQPAFSPDGRWLAYVSNESGTPEVYLRASSGAGKWLISSGGGVEPQWSPRGVELFFRNGTRMMRVAITAASRLSLSKPELLFAEDFELGQFNNRAAYSVSSDGQRFLMMQSDQRELRVVIDWFAELQRRVGM